MKIDTELNGYRYEGTSSCLHGEYIWKPCISCGRTQKEIDNELWKIFDIL